MPQVAPIQGKHIQVNGTTLWVEDTGEAYLPVLLCLHSCFLDGTMFEGVVQAASGKFRVIRPDFRGQGKSALHDVDIITMDQCAGDIEALIEAMRLKAINVMAQSMGGMLPSDLLLAGRTFFARWWWQGRRPAANPQSKVRVSRNGLSMRESKGLPAIFLI